MKLAARLGLVMVAVVGITSAAITASWYEADEGVMLPLAREHLRTRAYAWRRV
jgi:hypothetical protein